MLQTNDGGGGLCGARAGGDVRLHLENRGEISVVHTDR